MEIRQLGNLGPISALSLGGGGIGQVWGKTSADEAVATVKTAIDAGITLIDLSPNYGEIETLIGKTFAGKLPDDVRLSTKCLLGTPQIDQVSTILENSLTHSCSNLKREFVDIYYLHSQICPDNYAFARMSEFQDRWATRWSIYEGAVIPSMEKLKREGRIGAWGITGTGLPKCVMDALRHDHKPDAVQVIANLMDSPGDIRRYDEPPEPRNIIRTAQNNELGVLGVRALQAGALTSGLDRALSPDDPNTKDYEKAGPFRKLSAELGEDPAILALRYALAMSGVDSIIIGPKNVKELDGLIAAEARGPLESELVEKIDALGLARQRPKMPID